MSISVLPDFLINQIAAGEVVERPASVVKELVENALDAGAGQIVIDVVDGGRTMICVIDDGAGMTRDDLARAITRHATSKLPDDDLLNISFMGFRGEALPSIASVSDMTIDTCNAIDDNGWCLDANTHEIRPSDWQTGTRIKVKNLFAKTPARLKFLRGDRAELMSVLEVVKRLALARSDVGFVLNNKWLFNKNESLLKRVETVMGNDVVGRMLDLDVKSGSTHGMRLYGFVSEPTMRRASSVDQYLFVNGRPVKDKVLVGALRAAYMDVMHAREFPLCALYLELPTNYVDVNVSPAKTEVHFLEPTHVRSFIIKSLRERLAKTMLAQVKKMDSGTQNLGCGISGSSKIDFGIKTEAFRVCDKPIAREYGNFQDVRPIVKQDTLIKYNDNSVVVDEQQPCAPPLGRVIGQIGNKYIIAYKDNNMVVVDQHAAHERIVYEKLRGHKIKTQPLLSPIVVDMREEDVVAIMSVVSELKQSGLVLDVFGESAIAIFEKPADWNLDWEKVLQDIADEVRENGHSAQLNEKLHLKLANWACHHSVRAGQKLDFLQMDALLRDVEKTERAGQCNHGRPVYKFISITEMDSWFERL